MSPKLVDLHVTPKLERSACLTQTRQGSNQDNSRDLHVLRPTPCVLITSFLVFCCLGSELAADEFDGASQADDGQEAVILSYVVGMLTNFKTLPLERVHNMLKMFVTEPPYNKKIQELQAILDKLVSEEKLEVDGGNYTLKQA